MPTIVYTEQHVYIYTYIYICMYVGMYRWMDARIYVRNVVCIMNVRVCGGMCVYMRGFTQ